MHYWRITKYNPQYRDEKGRYLMNEWTSYSDIGKRFSDKILTMSTYITVESSYINVVTSMMNELVLSSFTIVELEKGEYDEKAYESNDVYKTLYDKLKEGKKIFIDEIGMVLRLILRETIWGKLVNNNAFVHFGYDYYMYVGAQTEIAKTKAVAQQYGLFVENEKSPYLL